ncbi:acyltransferase family protein [Flavitalea flava]
MKKIYSIQVLRGMAAISIVLYHMLIIEKKYSGGDLYLPFLFKMGQSGVDLFFVISGFIMVTITGEGSKVSTGNFLLHRAARIYPNYWFYFLITLSVFLINPSLVNSSQGNSTNFFTSFLLLPSRNLPLVLVAWSLIFELYFYLIFSFLRKGKGPLFFFGLVCWLAGLLLINTWLPSYANPSANPVVALLTSPYSIEFIAGALAAITISHNLLKKVPVKIFVLFIILLFVLYPFFFFSFYSTERSGLFLQSILFGIIFALLLISCVSIEQKTGIRFPRFLIRLGDISYTIYLSHVLIMGLIGKIWAAFFQKPDSMLDNLLVMPVILGTVIFYSFLGNRWIERPSYTFFIRLLSPTPKKTTSPLLINTTPNG